MGLAQICHFTRGGRSSKGVAYAGLVCLVLALTGGSLYGTAWESVLAQEVTAPAAFSANELEEIRAILEQGRALERQSRWGEALSLYEEALRRFPDHVEIQRSFHEARFHYDLIRRYGDSTFVGIVRDLEDHEAIQLYDEVLLKIQAHYVEGPHWNDLYAAGVRGLALALTEPKFLVAHGVSLSSEAAASAARDLEFVIPKATVYSRNTALEAATRLTRWLRERIRLPISAAIMEMVCGTVNALDPYSAFLTPGQLADLYSQIEGNFVGLGLELRPQEDVILVLRVIRGSPAEKAGIRPNDRIVAVDGQEVRAVSPERAAELLKGPEGTQVSLEIMSPGGERRLVSVVRTRVEVPSVTDVQVLDAESQIGYLRLLSFQRTTAQDVESALRVLQQQGVRSLIIDLRGNPGGLLGAAVETANLFLSGGVIVSTQGRNTHENLVYTAQEAPKWTLPLVVLIDQESASAAEIFAGAIQEQGRGTIVGTPSYGKGSIQGIFPLTITNAGLRLTTARFFSPKGRPYAGRGVIPDIRVQVAARPILGGSSSRETAGEKPQTAPAAQTALHEASNAVMPDPILTAGLQAVRQIMAQREAPTR